MAWNSSVNFTRRSQRSRAAAPRCTSAFNPRRPVSSTTLPASNLGPPAPNFYSLHERQSVFANYLKINDEAIFYSLQNRPFLKKRRKAKRPFVLSLSNGRKAGEDVHPAHPDAFYRGAQSKNQHPTRCFHREPSADSAFRPPGGEARSHATRLTSYESRPSTSEHFPAKPIAPRLGFPVT